MNECEVCGKALVVPSGWAASQILMFGDAPGQHELKTLRPWSGPAGRVLTQELIRAGIDPRSVRLTNLWLHEPDENCYDAHFNLLMKELLNKKAVMIMGAAAVKLFFGEPVSKVTGLTLKSPLLPQSVEVAMACINPAYALERGTVGEIRLAFTRFAKLTEQWR